LAYNWSDRLGEIDLLALDGETLVIIEVRSSETRELEELASTIDFDKQKRLTQATLRFLQKRKMLNRIGVRFDVVALRWPNGSREPQILHLRRAFESVGKFQLHA
jgi:putative endonuclease